MKQSIYKRILVAMIVGVFTATPVSTDVVFAAEENVNGSQVEIPADEQTDVLDAEKDAEADVIETDNISDENAASKDTKPVKANTVALAKAGSDTSAESEPVEITVIATGTYDSGLNWVLDSNGKLTISGAGKISSEQPWHKYVNQIEAIDIQDGVTGIKFGAFNGCDALAAITIPDSVTSIDEYVFDGFKKLQSVYISSIDAWLKIQFEDYTSNPLSNGADLYLNNTKVTDVQIPDGMTSIGVYAFYNCSSISSITIPDSVTSIGRNAFFGCTNLKSVYISSVEAWLGIGLKTPASNPLSNGADLYLNKKKVTALQIPDSVTSVPAYAFAGSTSLQSVTIPDGVTRVGDWAFSDCTALTTIRIPDSVTSIGSGVFRGCGSLQNIRIPDGVTGIGGDTFNGCSSLSSITIPDSVTSIGQNAFNGCSSLTAITLPDRVTSIGDAAFRGCSKLTGLTIPDSVTSINYYAFGGCSSLSSIRIPDSVTSIGQNAFTNCSSLTTIAIPDNVTSIGEEAFKGCSSVTRITLPASLTRIGTQAFDGCSAVKEFHISKGTGEWSLPVNNIKDMHVVIIDSGVTGIPENAFRGYTALNTLIIPDSVTAIGQSAFSDCTELSTAYIPASTSIEGGTFATCNSLKTLHLTKGNGGWNLDVNQMASVKKLIIEDGVTIIPYYAFDCCRYLTNVVIPDSVTAIRAGAFESCDNLVVLTLGKNVEDIDQSAFDGTRLELVFYNTCDANARHNIVIYGNNDRLQNAEWRLADHDYKTKTTDATLRTDGKKVSTCSVCGDVTTTDIIYHPASMKLSQTAYTYNGKVQKPTVTVVDSKGEIIAPENYTVTYSKSSSKYVGKYSVKITFKDEYSGSKTLTYKINPKGTSIAKLTRAKKSFKATWKKQATQTTGYQLQYSTSSKFKRAKTITITKKTTVSKTVKKLKAKKKYYVRVRTYKTVNKVKYYSAWSASKYVVTK